MKCKICGMTIRVPSGELPIKYIGKHYRKYHPERYKRKNKPAQTSKAAAVGRYCPTCGKPI